MAVDIICCETQPLTVLATVRSSGGEPAMSKAGEAWIDVSVTVRHGVAHWPGNPPIVVERSIDIGRGDDCNLSRLAMGVHRGTHNEGVARGAPVRPRPRAGGLLHGRWRSARAAASATNVPEEDS